MKPSSIHDIARGGHWLTLLLTLLFTLLLPQTLWAAVPTVTDNNISISGGSGAGGAYIKGDTVTATWNNAGGGDNNLDLTGDTPVTVDFRGFGGGAAVTASNSGSTWTANYLIEAGNIETTGIHVKISATNGDGTTTTEDSTNATVDNKAPTIISLSPTNGGSTAEASDNLVAVFSENMQGTGSISITDTTGDTNFANYSVTDSQIGLSGATLTINPSANLTLGHAYNVQFASGVLKDAKGNAFAGITSATGDGAWAFTAKGSQTVSFDGGTPTTKTLGDSAFAVTATSSASLTVTLTSTTTSVCTVSSSTVTILTVGTCTLKAEQAGDSSYNAATPVTTNIQVVKAEPTKHPNALLVTANTTTQITTTWTTSEISENEVVADGYLVVCSTTGNFTPQDGTPKSDDAACADGLGVKNVAYNDSHNMVWTNLASNSRYFFQIFPYTNSGSHINYKTADALLNTAFTPPTVTAAKISITGASASGAYIVGNTVTATWDNTALTGDNNPNINSVIVNFSGFGGGAAVTASNSSGIWTATYTITAGDIEASNINVAVSASFSGSTTTTTDDTNATVDNKAPTISSLSPVDNATGVAVGANLVMTFNENIQKVTDSVVTVNNSSNNTNQIIGVNDNVAVSNTTATIDPPSNLEAGSNYDVQFGGSVFKDSNGNAFAGIADGTTWNFTTIANVVPTLTAFSAAIVTKAEDTEAEISLANLKDQGDEADSDGTVDAFVVTEVSTGTVKIGANSSSATTWDATNNNTIDSTKNAYWTPAANANGTLNAFKVKAKDNAGAESSTAVQAQVTVTAVNDAPSVTGVSISGSLAYGQTLTASDTGFSDPDTGDSAGTHSYQWQRASNAACTTDKVDISGATSSTYTLTGNDQDKYICATITPKDNHDLAGTPSTGVTSAVIDKAEQVTLTAAASPASVVYGGTTTLSTSGGNGNGAVSYTVTAGGSYCSISGAILTGDGVGTCTVTATKATDANYNATTATLDVAVGKAAQASLTAAADPTSIAYNGTTALSTSGGSGDGAVSYAVTAGDSFCSINGSTLTGTGIGTCTVTATKATSTNYNEATATLNVAVGKAAQASLTATASPASIAYNGTTTLSTSGGSGDGAVSYAVTAGASFCSLSGTTLTGTGNGTCTVTATKATSTNYNEATATVNVTVNKADQTITFAQPAAQVFLANGTFSAPASSSSGLTVTLTSDGSICSVSGNTVTMVAPGNCVLTASQAGNGNYNGATPVVHTVALNNSNGVPVVSATSPKTVAAKAGVSAYSLTDLGIAVADDEADLIPVAYYKEGDCDTTVPADYATNCRVVPAAGFASGKHELWWVVEDSGHNRNQVRQTLNVLPQVGFANNLILTGAPNNGNVQTRLVLGGPSPSASAFNVPFTVAGTGSNPTDHNLVAGNFTFQPNVTASDPVTVTLGNAPIDGNTVIINLTTSNAVFGQAVTAGDKTSQTITISQNRVYPPRLSNLIGIQGTAPAQVQGVLFDKTKGNVQMSFGTNDEDGGNYTYSWLNSDASLVLDSGLGLTTATIPSPVLNISALAAGHYYAEVQVTDNTAVGSQPVTLGVMIGIVNSTPTGDADSDGDGETDASEGLTDTDGDGIPDYLDAYDEQANIVPSSDDDSQGYLVSARPGLRIRIGATATTSDARSVGISLEDIAQHGDNGQPTGNATPTNATLAYILDYEIENMDVPADPLAPGNTADLTIPLSTPLTAEADFLKYNVTEGWHLFTVDSNNVIAWAAWQDGVAGNCPAVSSAAYTTDLAQKAGKNCLRVTLQDGGPNDDDNTVNGRIKDPLGIGLVGADTPISGGSGGGGGGGSVGLVELLSVLLLLGLWQRRRYWSNYKRLHPLKMEEQA